MSWCAPRCTAPLKVVRNSRSASSTCTGFCDVAPESRYANWFPPRMTRLSIGKPFRRAVQSSVFDAVVMSGLDRLGEPFVAVLFEFVGQLRSAGLNDAAVEEDV